jgi:predicted PurR-regulated permease PerM
MINEFFVRMMTELIEGMRTRAGQGARCMHVCVNLSSAAIGRSATRNGHLLLYFLFSLFNHLNMTRSGGSFMLLLIFSFFIVFFGLIQAQDIPQKFFGAFQLDHSDNWDAYLAAKGQFLPIFHNM